MASAEFDWSTCLRLRMPNDVGQLSCQCIAIKIVSVDQEFRVAGVRKVVGADRKSICCMLSAAAIGRTNLVIGIIAQGRVPIAIGRRRFSILRLYGQPVRSMIVRGMSRSALCVSFSVQPDLQAAAGPARRDRSCIALEPEQVGPTLVVAARGGRWASGPLIVWRAGSDMVDRFFLGRGNASRRVASAHCNLVG